MSSEVLALMLPPGGKSVIGSVKTAPQRLKPTMKTMEEAGQSRQLVCPTNCHEKNGFIDFAVQSSCTRIAREQDLQSCTGGTTSVLPRGMSDQLDQICLIKKATIMAAPPTVAVGAVCTRRSSGATTATRDSAVRRTTCVRTN